MKTLTIQELESAINYYRGVEPATAIDSAHRLSASVRQLANIYGSMIYKKLMAVDLDTLSADQRILLLKVPASIKLGATGAQIA